MDRPRVTLCGLTRQTLHGLQLWFFFPRCHWCGDRTSSIEAHMRISHAGEANRRARLRAAA